MHLHYIQQHTTLETLQLGSVWATCSAVGLQLVCMDRSLTALQILQDTSKVYNDHES